MKTATFTLKGDVTEIMVYDQIGVDPWFGDGIDAKTFRKDIKAVKTPTINLRINSPGGSVVDGAAMLSALDEFKGRIEVDVDGLAASAASVLAMAGDEIRMASNALLMIHDPWGGVHGGAEDMRKMAETLDKIKGQIIDAYARKSNASREQLAEWMAAETWFTGQEAMDAGFADSVSQGRAVAACAGLKELAAKLGYRKMPEALANPPRDAKQWADTDKRRLIAASL